MPDSQHPFDLVVFDWDGTLMDSAGAIVAAIQAASRDLDLPAPDEQRARHVIGLGLGRCRFVPLSAAARIRVRGRCGALPAPLFRRRPRDSALRWRIRDAARARSSRTPAGRGDRQGALRARSGARQQRPRPFVPCHALRRRDVLEAASSDAARDHGRTWARVASLAVTYGAHSSDSLRTCKPLAFIESVPALRAWFAARA